ncbi:MAG: hypothetical protein JF615_11950 [Asticcacaulis sp.]|nr:hypothetical protein [Asticcacaulis sp.]
MDEKGHGAAEVSKTARKQAEKGGADPMPPEGTDEKVLLGDGGELPIAESDRIKATKAVIAKEER